MESNETTSVQEQKFYATKEEVVARAQELAASDMAVEKSEMELLKQLYYKYQNAAIVAARDAFIAQGGDADQFIPEIDPNEEVFRAALAAIRERRAQQMAQLEQQKAENLQRKLQILDRLQTIASTPEEANAAYDEFKALQTEWKDIKAIPAERATELWKNFQLYVEQFYDLLKIGHEMREYDFKKNLDTKTALCEKAEALDQEEDIISAFNQLQDLHQQWKEIGPVAKELREELWNRFKDASTVINKKHQAHFEGIKAREEENLQKKTALCEQIEAITTPLTQEDTEKPSTFAQWDELTQTVLAAQAEWKTIGFAPKKDNQTIFERFRQACDVFFTQKSEFYRQVKDSLNDNLTRKKALADQAEALKDSTDWKATTDAIVDLQKQWRQIGSVPKKYSDQLWKRFIGACDAFFEAKKKANSGAHEEERQNLQAKKDIITQLEALGQDAATLTADAIKELQTKWNQIGHVPFRDKDQVYAEYRAICDRLYDTIRNSRIASRTANRIQHIQQNLAGDRQRLQRAYDSLQAEIKTYENNIGFLTASSKKGNTLVDQMLRRVEGLKAELAEMKKKIQELN